MYRLFRGARLSHFRAVGRTVTLALLAGALPAGCGGGASDPGGDTGVTVSGTVRNTHTGDALAGATVIMGTLQATSDAAGGYELTNVPQGTGVIQCQLTGFEPYEASVSLSAGANTHDVAMARQTIFQFGRFAAYVPAEVTSVRGAVLVFGGFGHDSRGFATGGPIGSDPGADGEAQAVGALLRSFGRSQGLAVIGTSETATGVPNEPQSDSRMISSLETAAVLSGRPELASAPVFVIGMSRGGREASGLASRRPDRVAGVALWVPASAESLATAEARRVPTLMVHAEFDSSVDNRVTTQAFQANRAAGALWGMGVVPGTTHSTHVPSERDFIVQWMAAVANLRLPASVGGPTQDVSEDAGWLGDMTTFTIAPWASYVGDRATASWWPTEATAQAWQNLVTP